MNTETCYIMLVKTRMTSISNSFVRCLLCQGALPSTKNEVVEAHFQDQHRAYFNIDFLFKSSFLEENDMLRTLDFMVSLFCTNVEKEPDDTSIENDVQSKLVDLDTKKQIDGQEEASDNISSINLYEYLEDEDIFSSTREHVLKTEFKKGDKKVSNESEDLWNNIKMINSALKLVEKEDTFDREIENGDKGNGNESEDLRENTESMKSFPVAKFENVDTNVKNNLLKSLLWQK